jgi:hypothetical protein
VVRLPPQTSEADRRHLGVASRGLFAGYPMCGTRLGSLTQNHLFITGALDGNFVEGHLTLSSGAIAVGDLLRHNLEVQGTTATCRFGGVQDSATFAQQVATSPVLFSEASIGRFRSVIVYGLGN